MLQYTKRTFIYFIYCLTITVSVPSASEEEKLQTAYSTTLPPTLLQEKLESYSKLYPEILFLVLSGGDKLLDDMSALDLILGYQPVSLDYEHPPELREDLMIVSAERIATMLQFQAPSASLFRADKPLGWQEHVCVLTIDQHEIAADAIRATQHLLDLPEKIVRRIPHDFQLLPGDYLEFVLDHEIYHCLKSMYVGPQEMSHKEFWAEYNHFLDEQAADAYALGMHIKSRGKVTSFARNIRRIRGMALYNADPDHLTCKALEQVVKVPVEEITAMNARQVFNLANNIKGNLTIRYDEYLLHLASSVQAMKELGVEELVTAELRNRIKDTQPEAKQVKELVTNARRCLAELSGDRVE